MFLMGLGKIFTKKCPVTRFVLCGDYLKNFHKKVCPVTHFVRCGDYLKFWMGLRKISTKMCAQLHVLFAVETILSFGWHLEKFPQICVPSYTFFRSADHLKFLMGLGKLFTKKCAQLHVLFAVETILSFWWDLEKYRQKSVPSHTFLRCGDYLKFLRRVGKFRQKRCDQLHIFFAVQTISSFWWDLEKFSQKKCPVTRFVRCGDYLKFWMGLRKVSTKMCAQLHVLFAVETILSFGWHFEKVPQVCVPSYTFFFSQCRLSQVFDGTWKTFHKKVCPVTRFVRCGDYLKFLRRVGKFRQKRCDQLHIFFAVQTISSFWWDLEKFSQKSVPSYSFCSLWTLS